MIDLTAPDSRYDRQARITWWNQDRLRASSVLVVGAGALGNEIVKNLALLGVGAIDIVDMDNVERSNLARCVFFREDHEGRPKAVVVAEASRMLNPDVVATPHLRSISTVGLGWIASFDLVIAGLDNREARLWVNQACRKLGIPWIDGAIEGLQGLARVFLGEGACYECTLGETDWTILAARRSCSLLSTSEMLEGKVPTTATSASVVAGVQVQEAVKILTGRPDLLALRNQALVFVGETLETYRVEYGEDPDCAAHDRYDALFASTAAVGTLAALADEAEAYIGCVLSLDLEFDLVVARRCVGCGTSDAPFRSLATMVAGDGECSNCKEVLQLETRRSIAPDDPVAEMPLANLAISAMDVVTARSATARRHYILQGAA